MSIQKLDHARAEKLMDLASHLKEVKAGLEEALQDMRQTLREVGLITGNCGIEARARCTWMADIIMALSSDHDYLGGAGHTMQDTLEEIHDLADQSEEAR